MNEKVTNKNQPCPICGEVKFNYQMYSEFYCNNPTHSPIRRKKPYPDTETNAARLERLKDINDIKYIVALNNPTDDGCHPNAINFEREVDWLIEQAERNQMLENSMKKAIEMQEYYLITNGDLQDENKQFREVLKFYADNANYQVNVEDQWGPEINIMMDGGNRACLALEGNT